MAVHVGSSPPAAALDDDDAAPLPYTPSPGILRHRNSATWRRTSVYSPPPSTRRRGSSFSPIRAYPNPPVSALKPVSVSPRAVSGKRRRTTNSSWAAITPTTGARDSDFAGKSLQFSLSRERDRDTRSRDGLALTCQLPLLGGPPLYLEKGSAGGLSITLIRPQAGSTLRIPVSAVLGVTFDCYHEKLREEAVGVVTVVCHTIPKGLTDTLAWTTLGVITVIAAVCICLWLGPWSCAVATCAWAADVRRLVRLGPVADTWLAHRIILVTLGAGLWLLISIILPAFGHSAEVYTALVGLLSLPAAWWLADKSGAGPRVGGWFSSWMQWSRTHIRMPDPPHMQWPCVIRVSQEELHLMFAARSSLWRCPETRGLVKDVWLGSATVEAFMSLLPCTVYNSYVARRAIHLLMTYLLPAYTVLRGVGSLVPFAASCARYMFIFALEDAGMAVLASVLRVHVQGAGRIAHMIIKSAQAGLRVLGEALHQRTLLLFLGWCRSVLSMGSGLWAWAGLQVAEAWAFLIRALNLTDLMLRRWLVPSDYVFVYLRTRLMPFRPLLSSSARLWQAGADAWQDFVTNLKSLVSWILAPSAELFADLKAAVMATVGAIGAMASEGAQTARSIIASMRFMLTSGGKSLTEAARSAWVVLRSAIIRPADAPSIAQVTKKVADEGNRLAFYVNMKRARARELTADRGRLESTSGLDGEEDYDAKEGSDIFHGPNRQIRDDMLTDKLSVTWSSLPRTSPSSPEEMEAEEAPERRRLNRSMSASIPGNTVRMPASNLLLLSDESGGCVDIGSDCEVADWDSGGGSAAGSPQSAGLLRGRRGCRPTFGRQVSRSLSPSATTTPSRSGRLKTCSTGLRRPPLSTRSQECITDNDMAECSKLLQESSTWVQRGVPGRATVYTGESGSLQLWRNRGEKVNTVIYTACGTIENVSAARFFDTVCSNNVWMYKVTSVSRQLLYYIEQGPAEDIIYWRVNSPWPRVMKDRDCIFARRRHWSPREGGLVCNKIMEHPMYCPSPEKVRLGTYICEAAIQPIPGGGCTYAMRCELESGPAGSWLRWAMERAAPTLLEDLVQTAMSNRPEEDVQKEAKEELRGASAAPPPPAAAAGE